MKFLNLISILFVFNSLSIAQVDNVDSLNAVLDTISDRKDKISFCMQQGDAHMNTDLAAFEYWYFKGIQLGHNSEYEYMNVMLFAYLGYEYNARGDYEKHAEALHQGKTYLNENTPFGYRRTLMASEAEYYLRNENFDKAIAINQEILEFAAREKDSVSMSGTLHNMGIGFYKKGDIDMADSLIKKALIINKIIGQNLYAVNNLSMLANIESQRNNHKGSLAYNIEAMMNYKAMNEISGISFVHSNLAENYWELGNKQHAFAHLDSSLVIAKEYEMKEWEWNSYSRLARYYEEDGNYKKALEFYKLYSETKDNSVNEESSTKLESLTAELDQSRLEILEQKEALQSEQLALQEEKIISQENEKAKTRIQVYFLIGGLIALAAFGFFIYNRLKLTNKQKKIIEEKNAEVQVAYEKIEEKNLDITASINYAKRIQNAILPTADTLSASLKDHFVLFKPKDLVSGDFYWTQTLNDHTFIAVGDCTGHGVPGALVSVICHNALNRSVKEFNLVEPGEILNKTREIVIEQFAKSHEDVKDGMDIALCSIHTTTKELKFAGANNPLWVLRNNEVVVTKGDKQPIGNHAKASPFQTHAISTEAGDQFYIFSDGYADQFGGEKGKKFKSKSLASLLLELKSTPLSEQSKKLDEAFETWKSDFEQLDDVCLIGFKI